MNARMTPEEETARYDQPEPPTFDKYDPAATTAPPVLPEEVAAEFDWLDRRDRLRRRGFAAELDRGVD